MFERGLPGYDSWLDNYGNPGIYEEDALYPDWALTGKIDVTMTSMNPDIYLIQRVDMPEQFNMSFGAKCTDPDKVDERTILIDGEDIDLGDDFIAFVSILDEYHEQGGELGKTVRQESFQQEEE
jgi:hypothetical protein